MTSSSDDTPGSMMRPTGMNATVDNAAALIVLSLVVFSHRETSGGRFRRNVLEEETQTQGP
jgi:hypothetical protein